MKAREAAGSARATPEHWRALFAGALLCLAGCARCAGAPSEQRLKCRRCRVDLAVAGLSAYRLVSDVDADEIARGAG